MSELDYAWDSLYEDPTTEMIFELTQSLNKTQMAEWTVQSSRLYQEGLEKIRGTRNATQRGRPFHARRGAHQKRSVSSLMAFYQW